MNRIRAMLRLKDELPGLHQALAGGLRIALFLDFDGTLAEIRETPSACSLSMSMRAVISQLTELPRCSVVIVSGRPVSDLRAHVDIPGIHIAGNHGLFVDGPQYKFAHPALDRVRPAIAKLCHELIFATEGLQGVWIEDKSVSCALHYRQASAADALQAQTLFHQVMRRHADKDSVRVISGKKVLEILPDIDWHKGRAVQWILERIAALVFPVYIGDDVTDEDAFEALSHRGLTIRVGKSDSSNAGYYIPRQADVEGVLRRIFESICRT